jgi:type IV secretion system protein VirD4
VPNAVLYFLFWKHSNFFLTYAYLVHYYGIPAPKIIYVCYSVSFLLFVVGMMALFIKNKNNKYGDAREATKSEAISKLKLKNDTGIILGKKWGMLLRYNNPLSLLVIAPPGTGKTQSVIAPNLLSMPWSCLVYDPKGELTDITSGHRSTFSKVFIFDPVSDDSVVFNPLDINLYGIKPDSDLINHARAHYQNVANTLIKFPDKSDDYWVKAARSVFVFTALWALWKYKSVSIADIRELIYAQTDFNKSKDLMLKGLDPRSVGLEINDNKEKLEKRLQLLKSKEHKYLLKSEKEELAGLEERIKKANYIDQNKEEIPNALRHDANSLSLLSEGESQLTGVIGTLEPFLQIFADENIKKATTGVSEFNPLELRNNPTTVYLKVRDKDKDRLADLLGLIVNTFANQLTSHMPSVDDQRVTLVLDEYLRLGKLSAIGSFPDISRGYNCNGIFVAQNYSQISAVYGHEVMETFEQNCAYKVVFRQNNQKTAQIISRTIGNFTDDRKSRSKDLTKIDQKERSEQISQEGLPLYSDQRILNLKSDEVIVLVEGFYKRPILAKPIPAYKTEPFKSLMNKE